MDITQWYAVALGALAASSIVFYRLLSSVVDDHHCLYLCSLRPPQARPLSTDP